MSKQEFSSIKAELIEALVEDMHNWNRDLLITYAQCAARINFQASEARHVAVFYELMREKRGAKAMPSAFELLQQRTVEQLDEQVQARKVVRIREVMEAKLKARIESAEQLIGKKKIA